MRIESDTQNLTVVGYWTCICTDLTSTLEHGKFLTVSVSKQYTVALVTAWEINTNIKAVQYLNSMNNNNNNDITPFKYTTTAIISTFDFVNQPN